MTPMRMLTLNSYHSQIPDLVMVNKLGVVPPRSHFADGHSYGCIAAPYPCHGVMADEYAQVPL